MSEGRFHHPENPLPDDEAWAAVSSFGVQDAPEELDRDWLLALCERKERVLRNQYRQPDDKMPEEYDQRPPWPERWEERLARFPPTSTARVLRRLMYVQHLYLRHQERRSREDKTKDARRAMREALRREPVRIQMAGRTVEVTDRSWDALYAIASHAARVRQLTSEIEALGEDERELRAALEEAREAGESVREIRASLQIVRDLGKGLYEELSYQRRAIYAHMFTEDGAPAESVDEAPEWWDELRPVDDLALVDAVHRTMATRWQRMGQEPDPPPRKESSVKYERLENWGFATLFSVWDKETPVDAAPTSSRPLLQQLSKRRAGRDPVRVD